MDQQVAQVEKAIESLSNGQKEKIVQVTYMFDQIKEQIKQISIQGSHESWGN